MHGKQLMRSECSEGRGQHGEFVCSFPTRSGSQRRWDFMSNFSERKIGYLRAEEVRKEEAGGIREPTLSDMVLVWPLHHRMKEEQCIHQGRPTFGISGPHWKKRSCLGPHIKYITTCNHKKSHNVLSKFTMLGWASFTATLGHVGPTGRRLDTPASLMELQIAWNFLLIYPFHVSVVSYRQFKENKD